MAAAPKIISRKTGKNMGLILGGLGLLLLLYSLVSSTWAKSSSGLVMSLGLIVLGSFFYSDQLYRNRQPGIHNDGVWFTSLTNRGILGWFVAMALTVFYCCLYFYPERLGYYPNGNTGLIQFFDPLSLVLNGKFATQWFVYGVIYTLAILLFGIKFLYKYRHSRYQSIRTLSVMFFQLCFAFLIPEFLSLMHPDTPYFAKDLKNMWPLNHYFFESWHLNNMLNGGTLGLVMLGGGLSMIFIISPVLTYWYGKRWYCSWVCGCGALAETAGDPFRQLSSKSLSIWKLERWIIHLVLVLVVLTTIAVLWSFLGKQPNAIYLTQENFIIGVVIGLSTLMSAIYCFKRKELNKDALYSLLSVGILIIGTLSIQSFSGEKHILFIKSYTLTKWYGFAIGAIFSGVLGVGFYPLLGSRVWCRFGCPMAAILGLQQRLFSRFRITTNGGQCISCGNCSTYCEMGIDVRAYAQRGQNIVRSSCVGCGICSTVCPRGVLKLENGPVENRTLLPPFPLGNATEKQS